MQNYVRTDEQRKEDARERKQQAQIEVWAANFAFLPWILIVVLKWL
jgi:hypothetical protein